MGDSHPEEGRISEIKKELEEEKKQASELTKRMMYLQADILNLQKQSGKREEQAREDASLKYLFELISLKEDLERALSSTGEETPAVIKDGLSMMISRIDSDLRSDSVERMKVKSGMDFDPRLHEAISYNHSEGRKEGTIISIVSHGYTYRGKVIKPALVEVARQKDADEARGEKPPQVAPNMEIKVAADSAEQDSTKSK